MLTVACVLRSGGDYYPEYVERLWLGCARQLLHRPEIETRFVCLTDTDVPCERIPLEYKWPGWWSKMELMRPDLKGDILYFDLDTIIVGDLIELASINTLALLTDFIFEQRMNSGVMFLPESARAKAWKVWSRNPAHYMDRFATSGDGAFLAWVFSKKAQRLQNLLPGQIVSYKQHVRNACVIEGRRADRIPNGARVVCFHGQPRPPMVYWMADALERF